MRNCSISNMPFYKSPEAVLIPVLIKKQYSDNNEANSNIIPFPISINVELIGDEIFVNDPDEDNRVNSLLSMISSVFGYDDEKLDWDEVYSFRGDEKEVEFEDKEYILGYFICHKSIYDSIISNFKVSPYFNETQNPLNFDEFKESFKKDVNKNITKRNNLDSSYKEKLGIISFGFAIPEDFQESDLDYFAEIQFIHRYLSLIGNHWNLSKHVSYQEDLIDVLKIHSESVKKVLDY